MVTMTYLLVVAGLGLGLWRWAVRARGTTAAAGRHPSATTRLRAVLAGSVTDDDLVERMAGEIVARTVTFGSSHAVPGHLGAELPSGVFEAATAAREQLTAEVLHRYCALMDERCNRLGRAAFALPERYALHLALACGPDEILTASFEAIVDVRAAARRGGPSVPAGLDPAPTARRRPELDEVTVRRVGRSGRTVVLEVDGKPYARAALGDGLPALSVGRGTEVALRCPEHLEDVSRHHLELLWSEGRCYVADAHSANGTWLAREDGHTVPLVPGERCPLAPGETVLLDEERQVTVSLR